MTVQKQIKEYIAAQPEPKRSEMQELHDMILGLMPACKLWFLDGKDGTGKVVSNPNIGYGFQTMEYANGKSREFYQIGVSANTTGISVYIMGLDDKKYLAQTFERDLGKASVTGYCIKFKRRSQSSDTVWDWTDRHSTLMHLESTRYRPGNRFTSAVLSLGRHHRLICAEIRIRTEISAYLVLCSIRPCVWPGHSTEVHHCRSILIAR